LILDDLSLQFWLSPAVLGVVGLLVGSFLNVVIHRLPLMMERQWWGDVAAQLGDAESHRRVFGRGPAPEIAGQSESLLKSVEALPPLGLARPASRCPHCGHRIRWYENVPLVSWIVLRGRCSACGASIGWRYPLVELLTGALFALIAWRLGPTTSTMLWCVAAALLVAMSAIDWDTTVLPDTLTLSLLWMGLLAAAAGGLPGVDLRTSVIGAAAGYGALWAVYWVFRLATGKEGMGFGDFKLLAALGAWLGWTALLPIVLGASIVGAIAGLAMKAAGALREGRFVPFGPFLAAAGLAVMLLGPSEVLQWMGW
jgi:leader peptidase (prepilin peptidase)/N-methyltransferase